MTQEYDLVIVGGGTGGYVAAIRASRLGLKTALVEKDKVGGTCLHSGCIPSKALLRSAEVFKTAKQADAFGVIANDVHLNFKKVQQRKKQIIDQLYKGVQQLIKQGKVDLYQGTGRILGPSIFSPIPGTISVEMAGQDDNEMLIPKNVIIATGSRPRTLPGLTVDGIDVVSSAEALEFESLPSSIIIIGGGAIGIEWASMLSDFGVDVTVLEYASQIIPNEDEEIAKELQRLLEKKGIKIVTEVEVLTESLEKSEGKVSISAKVNGTERTFPAEKILVSVGREANIDDIGLQNTNIVVENDVIQVNEHYQTKETHIYAIGDVIGGLQLAHVASHEGMRAVDHIIGKESAPLPYKDVPRCIYSNPEVASVGLTEKEAIENDFDVVTGKFPFRAIGKAVVFGETDGFVKIVADRKTDDILGIHMIGPNVTDMISEAGLARVLDATPWEIAQTIHPHPSLSETLWEAALAVEGLAIHS